MKTFEKMKLWLPWNLEENKDIETPLNIKVIFELKYKKLLIGYLRLNNGEWSCQLKK